MDLLRVQWGDVISISKKGTKILTLMRGIFILTVVLLQSLSFCRILVIPRWADPILCGVCWLGCGFLETNRKHARWWNALAAAHFILALILSFR